ncbi:MAG: glycosyl hydrolase 53 family protein [Lachnospiraceae bacterium]|nr:glycosyl hydrolase 53 family protein [Lachnospiraceae bacterium]
MNRLAKKILAAILCAGLVVGAAGCGKGAEEPADSENVTQDQGGAENDAQEEQPPAENTKYIIKGADISSLEAVEDYGGKFYGFDGSEVDVIKFLAENGCNYYRLRIWNNPTASFDAGDYCNLEHTIEMAKRIKEAGISYLLDFHYSDWWADPENQTVPAAWQGMSEEELATAVYDYTAEVLTALAEENAYPDMVQIGNEIGNGMLWDYGSMEHPETLAKFLNSGIKAVRDTTPAGQETLIMIHVQTGGSVGATQTFFETIEANGVTDYDLVGLSYYPYWQGTFADMKANIDNIYEQFGKQTVLAETAYPFTNDNADNKSNMVSEADIKGVGFEASEENQRRVLELIMNAVAECEGGLGIFYWEPAWLAVEGAGVSKGSGNEWENQTLFDFEGKALDAVRAFAFEPGSLDNDVALYVYPFDSVEIDENASGEELIGELPETARVLYQDGSIREVEVTWDISSMKTITDTHVAFKGTVLDFTVSLGADLIAKNSLNNLDFEEGATGWVLEDEKRAGQIRNDSSSYPHSGEWSFQYWNADAFTMNLYQQVEIAQTDQYHLQVWSQGVGDTDLLMTLYIADADGNLIASTEFRNQGWNEWQHPIVSAQLSEGDIVRIGVLVDAGSDDWGTMDEFTFYTGEPQADGEGTDAEDGEGNDGQEGENLSAAAGTNLIENASFESGDNGWTIKREGTGAGTVRNDSEGNPHSGDYSFHYWNDSDFTITVSQKVTIESGGIYTLRAYSQGDSDTDTYMTLYAEDENGNVIDSVDFSNRGWDVWQNPAVEALELDGGATITVGIVIHGKAGGWGTIDDISLSAE